MAHKMQWQRGFKRIRLVGTVALVLGAVLFFSVLLTHAFGYAPDPAFAQLYSAFWPLGLMLLVLGALLWATVWMLMGFLPYGDISAGTAGGAESARFSR